MRNFNKWLVGAASLLIFMIFAAGLIVGKGSKLALSAETETYQNLRTFTEILSVIQKNYVDDVNGKDLVYGAIRGMLNTLDPHSVFMTPEMYKEVQVDTKGEFGGLGIQIAIKDNRLTVIAPIEGTPADKAGILAGDWIAEVDSQTTADMTLLDAVQKMRGPRGTSIAITVRREGEEDSLIFNLTRELIKIESVKSEMIDDSIGYIRIAQFQERTGQELAEHLENLNESNMESLVLDLRNNPGGLLTSALEVSEQFLPQGKMIVYTENRDGKRDEYKSSGKGVRNSYPMIILVNEGSASASEIVAGALKDWGRALLLGTNTFGKGSVQTILPLEDGSGLRLTTARYYTPKGGSIHNKGVLPDIEVELPSRTNMPPPIREKDLEGRMHAPIQRPQEPKKEESDNVEDLQLKKATELLKSWGVFKNLRVDRDLPLGPLVEKGVK
jgi:carboxyl-terminal processing protease